MPLNEAYGFHRSNLTKEQKRAAEAAVYGQSVPSMPPNALTHEEIERMRTLVAQQDAQGAVKEFDLNNPATPPYVFQPFPTTVYHHATKRNKIVADQEALDAALAEGWKHAPIPRSPGNRTRRGQQGRGRGGRQRSQKAQEVNHVRRDGTAIPGIAARRHPSARRTASTSVLRMRSMP